MTPSPSVTSTRSGFTLAVTLAITLVFLAALCAAWTAVQRFRARRRCPRSWLRDFRAEAEERRRDKGGSGGDGGEP